jgi:hypothetical protein
MQTGMVELRGRVAVHFIEKTENMLQRDTELGLRSIQAVLDGGQATDKNRDMERLFGALERALYEVLGGYCCMDRLLELGELI